MRQLILVLLLIFSRQAYSQDTAYLKVHFLYGSKPVKKFKESERKWFGGILGGHVGLETEPDQIVNFMRGGEFHWIAKDNNRHSRYTIHSFQRFYSLFGANPDSVKRAVVTIPITRQQKQKLDSITTNYRAQTPYDYAFLGMRCGAATYEILGQLKILPAYKSYRKTSRKIFYPKKLRKRLFKKAAENGWVITRQAGSKRRKWEKD